MLSTSGHASHWNKTTVKQAVQLWVTKHRRLPHRHEWGLRGGLPSQSTVVKYWGSQRTLYGALQIPSITPKRRRGKPKRWDRDSIVAAMQAWSRRHAGVWPQTHDFERDASLPHPTVVNRTIGTLAQARRLAGATDGGFEGHGGPGRGGGVRPTQRMIRQERREG
jgi:hypothetical protein